MTDWKCADSSEFATARANAVGGDTIELTGQQYDGFAWTTQFASEVLVYGTPGQARPVISFQGRVNSDWNDLSNVTFRYVDFSKKWNVGDGANTVGIRGDRMDTITWDNCRLYGGLDASDVGAGKFLQAIGGTNLSWINCEMFWWATFLVAGGITGLTVENNHIHYIRSDGMTLDAITGGSISYNYFHDFAVGVVDDHPDMVQVTRSSSRQYGTTDLNFLGNVCDAGVGRYGQIFFGGTGGNTIGGPGTAWRHTNWRIEDNLIICDHNNVISFHALDNSFYRRNTAIWVDNGFPNGGTPAIGNDTGDGNTFEDNISELIKYGNNPVLTTNNHTVTKAQQATYYNILHSAGVDGFNGFEMVDTSPIGVAGAGTQSQQKVGGWPGGGIRTNKLYYDGNRPPGTPPQLPLDGQVNTLITAA